jgi:hypothetical protein
MPENLDVIFNVQYEYTVNKFSDFNYSRLGNVWLWTMDIPAGDGKIANLFILEEAHSFLPVVLSAPPPLSRARQTLHPTHRERRVRERKGSETHNGQNA